MEKIRGFEKVTKYNDEDVVLPFRATKNASAYDMTAVADIEIPPIDELHGRIIAKLLEQVENGDLSETGLMEKVFDLTEVKKLLKEAKAKPTLISTGVKAYMKEDEVLNLYIRSGMPLSSLVILANSVGVIDADYYNNPDNEGEIFFQVINLSPLPIQVKKGDRLGQGMFVKFLKTDDDAQQEKADRESGLGSTGRR